MDVVAGVYRGKPETSDVDLICLVEDLGRLRSLNPVKEDSVRMVFEDSGAKIEVWKSGPEDYELKKWYRRLPPGEFVRLAVRAKERGLTLSWQRGLLDPEGKVITRDPREIERLLGD